MRYYSPQRGVARSEHSADVICLFNSLGSLESTYQKWPLRSWVPLECLGRPYLSFRTQFKCHILPGSFGLSCLFRKKPSCLCVCSCRLWWHQLRSVLRAQSLALRSPGCACISPLDSGKEVGGHDHELARAKHFTFCVTARDSSVSYGAVILYSMKTWMFSLSVRCESPVSLSHRVVLSSARVVAKVES